MIAYIIISYLVMMGVLIEQYDHIDEMEAIDYGVWIISPIALPVFIGIKLNSL